MRIIYCYVFAACAVNAANFQPVNLNAASKEQLMVLPGVGEKLAQRIVDHRSENGLFASLDDLLLVKGLRPKLLNDLSGKIELSKARKGSDTAKLPAKTEVQKGRSEAEIEALLAQLDNEPSPKEVQRRAVDYATANPERINDWLSRARLAPALPSFSLSTGKGLDSNAVVRERLGDPSVFSRRDASDFNLNVKVEWKFGELLFNRNELYVAREAFRMAVIRERILHDVAKNYIERRKAQLKSIASESMSALERAELRLYIEELTAILDGLTGGWFGDQIAQV